MKSIKVPIAYCNIRQASLGKYPSSKFIPLILEYTTDCAYK